MTPHSFVSRSLIAFAARATQSLCLLLSLVVLPLVLPSLSLAAETPFAAAVMSDDRVAERLDFLDRRFAAQQPDAELWEYGWGAFNGGSLVLSVVQAAQADNHKDRSMSIVQSVESLVGVADIIFRPLPSFDTSTVCPQKVTTREDRRQCLAAKEALAQRAAERADEPYQLLPHLEILGANLVAGGVVWALAGFHRAFITAVPGEVIGEIQLWTTPGQPSRDYQDYQVRFSPMVQVSSRDNAQLVGIQAQWNF